MKSAEIPRKQMYFKLDKTQQKFSHSGEILLMEEEKRLKLYLSETKIDSDFTTNLNLVLFLLT